MTIIEPSSPDSALAPFFNVPREMQMLFDEIGARWAEDVPHHIHQVVDAYTQLASRGPKDGVHVQRDERYGPHARHRLDIFSALAPQDGPGADVLVFVHGGAFVRGEKNVTDELYDNVCYWFAQRGVVAVNLEYRLAGDAPFPSGAEDVALAMRHLARHVARFGGNGRRMFVAGHSAGGSHVATYCCDPALAASFDSGVVGAMLLSARVRADVERDNPNAEAVRAYFGGDESSYGLRSPVSHASQCRVPVLIAVAQYENPHLDTYGAEMLLRILTSRGVPPRFLQMRRHNHLSIVAHFNTGEEMLGREMLAFMQSV